MADIGQLVQRIEDFKVRLKTPKKKKKSLALTSTKNEEEEEVEEEYDEEVVLVVEEAPRDDENSAYVEEPRPVAMPAARALACIREAMRCEERRDFAQALSSYRAAAKVAPLKKLGLNLDIASKITALEKTVTKTAHEVIVAGQLTALVLNFMT